MMKGRQIANLWLLRLGADFAAIVTASYATVVLRFHSSWGERFFTAVNRVLGVGAHGEIGAYFEDFYIVSAARICLLLTGLVGLGRRRR